MGTAKIPNSCYIRKDERQRLGCLSSFYIYDTFRIVHVTKRFFCSLPGSDTIETIQKGMG